MLGNPRSIVHRLLVSPFVKNLKMTHYSRDQTFYRELKANGRVMSASPERASPSAKTLGRKPLSKAERAIEDGLRESI